ncbi:hypothetical protein L5515_009057 [Caenorhabditis briggsae]|uniref:Uncharacterized protein n=2 Tax=Caenorhabditis briggsae TaxID=6238 RepID=A0AAE9F7U6_CAEBR|nr:hypothetical protein L5515_009057 [Caenorhabditis briggsae]
MILLWFFTVVAVFGLPIMGEELEEDAASPPVPPTFAKVGGNVEIKLPQVAKYRRIITNQDNPALNGPQIYRVCNGKNKKTCGFWENAQTRKKIPSGTTTYNKNKKALIIKKLKKSDFGYYTTRVHTTGLQIFRTVQESPASGK